MTAKINGANERIKRQYFAYLKEAKGRDEATIDGVAKSLARFEDATGRRAFKRFHREQAVAFKRALVRRQNIWHNSRRKLGECRPRLGVDVKRRACGEASADVRWSVA